MALSALPPSPKSRSSSIRQGFDGSEKVPRTRWKKSQCFFCHTTSQDVVDGTPKSLPKRKQEIQDKAKSIGSRNHFNDGHEEAKHCEKPAEFDKDGPCAPIKTWIVNIETGGDRETDTKMSKPKLSPGDIQTKRNKLLKTATKITKKISKMSHLLETDEKKFPQFVGYVTELDHDVFNGFQEFNVPADAVEGHQTDVSQVVYESGTHEVVCDVVTSCLSKKNYVTQVEDDTVKLMGALTNYSDSNDDVRDYMIQDSDFLPALVHTLESGLTAHLDQEICKTNNLMRIIDCCMKILSNCAMNEKNIPRLLKAGTVRVLLQYRDSHNECIQLTSLHTLAKLVNEEEAENLLFTHGTIFTLLIQRLDKAWHSSTHREDWGWDVKELTKTIGQLARNDTNKKVLVHNGCLPLLVKILDSKDVQEVEDSVDTLWVLSFDKFNKQRMVEEPNLVKRVWAKYSHDSSTGEIKKSSYGILWSLKDQLKKRELEFFGIAMKIELEKSQADMKPTQQSQQQTQGTSSDGESFRGYVMLSYSKGHQKIVLQIRDKLKDAGVPVWIDVDFMMGSTLGTMAKAVEDCSIFVMAVSQGYKNSSNCRLEAEYAQKLKKPILPLMMAKDYNPDGWLGIIMGSTFFYEFSGKYPSDNTMSKLLKAIRREIGQGISTEIKKMIESSPGSEIDQKTTRPSQEEETQSIVTITCNIYR